MATIERFQAIVRPRLEATLDRALGHRLTLVVADAGSGKTTLLRSWTRGINATVHDVTGKDCELAEFSRHVIDALRLRVPNLPADLSLGVDARQPPEATTVPTARPDAIAEYVGNALAEHLFRDVALVLDDVHLLGDGESTRFLAGLVRHAPPLLHLVLAGRTPPRLKLDRLREHGEVLEVHGADLGFTVEETAELLAVVTGEGTPALAHAVVEATAGWPAAVRLTLESLRGLGAPERQAALPRLTGERGALGTLVRSLFRDESPEAQRVLAVTGLFDEASLDLLDAVDETPSPAVRAEAVEAMLRRGLYLEPGPSGHGWFRLHAAVAEVVAADGPLSPAESDRIRVAAAHWFHDGGRLREALRAVLASGDVTELASLLSHCGPTLLTLGHARDVQASLEVLPAAARTPSLERLAGETCQLLGRWTEALDCYRRASPGEDEIDTGLAWRMGLIHYLRGDLEQAVRVFSRSVPERTDADTALLLAWHASALWKLGDIGECGRLVAAGLRVATECQEPRALAAVHTVLGMLAVSEGDRRANDAHYLKAVEYAERAGDVLQLVRIRCNRGSHLVEEGDYEQALVELGIAIRLADLSGFLAFGALALNNRGEANLGLCRLEEAQRDLESASVLFADLGSAMQAYPLTRLGVLHHLRGDRAAARTSLEGALTLAERAGDVQARVGALAALARLATEDDPSVARRLAAEATATDCGLGAVDALLAAAWAARASGDPDAATRHAQEAAELALARRDRRGRAEALVLQAGAASDPGTALALAEQAGRESAALGDVIGGARADLERARHLAPGAAGELLAASQARMRAIGCRLLETEIGVLLAALQPTSTGRPRVETLGRFRILHDGRPAYPAAWKSAKARHIVKILVSRRGRAVSREQLMDLLWPGRPPEELGNRFNVALSGARSLLDPARSTPDGYVVVAGDSVALDGERLDVDVERFLADVAAGERLLRQHREAEAEARLALAEASYAGDFLEEDRYEDWAHPLREEARAAYQGAAFQLARLARDRQRFDAAVRYLLRVLERDRYDERSHLELVAVLSEAGRHGDARRHYRTYCAAMEELGVDAAPFRACLAATGPRT